MVDLPCLRAHHLLSHDFSDQLRIALGQQRKQLRPVAHRVVHHPELLVSIRAQRVERMQHGLHGLEGIYFGLCGVGTAVQQGFVVGQVLLKFG